VLNCFPTLRTQGNIRMDGQRGWLPQLFFLFCQPSTRVIYLLQFLLSCHQNITPDVMTSPHHKAYFPASELTDPPLTSICSTPQRSPPSSRRGSLHFLILLAVIKLSTRYSTLNPLFITRRNDQHLRLFSILDCGFPYHIDHTLTK